MTPRGLPHARRLPAIEKRHLGLLWGRVGAGLLPLGSPTTATFRMNETGEKNASSVSGEWLCNLEKLSFSDRW
jgi:hypothetical protein